MANRFVLGCSATLGDGSSPRPCDFSWPADIVIGGGHSVDMTHLPIRYALRLAIEPLGTVRKVSNQVATATRSNELGPRPSKFVSDPYGWRFAAAESRESVGVSIGS